MGANASGCREFWWLGAAHTEYCRAMSTASVCVSALIWMTGCYAGGGLGYAGGNGATGHLTLGFAIPLGERGALHAGAGAAIGPDASDDEEFAVSGPATVGGDVQLFGNNRRALVGVAALALPFGGNWARDQRPTRVGRLYSGLGYQHTMYDADRNPEHGGSEKRRSGTVVVSAGPEVFWTTVDNATSSRVGVAVDAYVTALSWTVVQTLFDDP